jgi:hypothetical protein
MTTMIAQSPGLICSVAPKGLKPIVALESKNASKDAGATVNRAILPENNPTPCPDFVNPRNAKICGMIRLISPYVAARIRTRS